MSAARYIGAAVRRREDERILRGDGRYIGDLRLPNMVDAALVRSDQPHAVIGAVRVAAAHRLPGVVGAVCGSDLIGRVAPFTRLVATTSEAIRERYEVHLAPYRADVLAVDRVHRVGEPIAAIVAVDRATAEDAAELVEVEYDPLGAVTSAEQALAPGAPQLHAAVPGNVAATMHARVGQPEAAFAAAACHLQERFVIHRSSGSPIGMRGTLADWNRATGQLTVWSTTQRPHVLRSYIAEMLELAETDVRVVAPDIGGSFGGAIYSEEILVAHLARQLERPVRWLEDRRESMFNSRHSRDQVHDVSVGFDRDGRIRALLDAFTMDCGNHNPYGVNMLHNTLLHLPGQYRLEHLDIRATACLTNKLQVTPVRGTGRPEAVFVMERVIDLIAEQLGHDPMEVRDTNLIRPVDLPYSAGLLTRDGEPLVHTEGDYPQQLARALDVIGYRPREDRPPPVAANADAAVTGVGVAGQIETTGSGPFEGASIQLRHDGTASVATGAASQGQGHETVLAQIAADALGVPLESVRVGEGDTALIERGSGTFASRTVVAAGSAIHMAASNLRHRVRGLGAQVFGADDADEVTVRDGAVWWRGERRSIADVLAASPDPDGRLEETAYFYPPSTTLASSTHAARVSVDPAVGVVRVLDYVVVHDSGTEINPALVEGQMHGGAVHGIGNALWEEIRYGDDGSLKTTSLADYALPTIGDVPLIQTVALNFPATTNPLGAKGCGEGGTVGAPAAVVNAIADALRHTGARLTELPMTHERLIAAIDGDRSQGGRQDSRQSHRQPARLEKRGIGDDTGTNQVTAAR